MLFRSGKARELRDALDNMPELEAELILREAMRDDDLLDGLKERASIRWAEGLSDSLLDAVLCNFTPLNERVQRDEQGHIVLKARTDWDKELDGYRR